MIRPGGRRWATGAEGELEGSLEASGPALGSFPSERP